MAKLEPTHSWKMILVIGFCWSHIKDKKKKKTLEDVYKQNVWENTKKLAKMSVKGECKS